MIKPISNRVVVRRLNSPEMTEGGLFIPKSAQKKSVEGEVLAVGLGKILDNGRFIPTTVKRGNRVLFMEYGGYEIDLCGEELIILCEDEILAVIEGQ